jgi:hypothetical protein
MPMLVDVSLLTSVLENNYFWMFRQAAVREGHELSPPSSESLVIFRIQALFRENKYVIAEEHFVYVHKNVVVDISQIQSQDSCPHGGTDPFND